MFASRIAVLLLLFGCSASAFAQVEISGPKVMLDVVDASFTLTNLGKEPADILVNGQLAGTSDANSYTLEGISANETLQIEVRRDGALLLAHEVPVISGWISLLPPFVAIALAFLFRAVVPALFAGLLVGAWAVNGLTLETAFASLFEVMTVYIQDALSDRDNVAIILFTVLIGGMVGIVSRNGGMVGIVNAVLPLATTSRRVQAVIAALGLSIFFDDYANTLIVGNATRPVSDKLRISREKLAYLVDSTAAPVATVAVITTWIGFQVGLIDEAISDIEGITAPAYSLFLNSIAYSFYPFLAIFLVFLVVLTGKDFGPMYKAEVRARTTGQVAAHKGDGSQQAGMEEFSEKEGIPCRAINGVLPILTLVFGVIGGMMISGEGDTLQDIIGSADAYVVLIWASLLACVVAFFLTLAQGLLSVDETLEAWTSGAKFMLSAIIILVMAWGIADVTSDLQTAPFLVNALGDALSPYSLPALIFLLAAAAAFATGTSWGVMAILMPLVIPLCWATLQVNGMADAEHMYILYASIACVLTGSVWADHCSPIADTTVLSCLATDCDLMDHVTTQIPYALLGGITTLVVCVLPTGYGVPWWLMLPLAAGIIFAVHRFFGKSVDLA